MIKAVVVSAGPLLPALPFVVGRIPPALRYSRHFSQKTLPALGHQRSLSFG